jgi:hypothetical protein
MRRLILTVVTGLAGFLTTTTSADTMNVVTIVGPAGKTPQMAGTLSTAVQPNGDVLVTLTQYVNDNTYGTSASPGWGKGGHKFNDLIGSDQAEFRFTDGKGNVVLDFDADYVSHVSSLHLPSGTTVNYPSGYGTAGLAGDGKLITGNAAFIESIDTSITDNLNQSPVYYGFIINSPAAGSPLFGGWNPVNRYTVAVSGAAFGSNGFGGVTVPEVHDSPAKPFTAPATPLPPTVWMAAGLLAIAGLRGWKHAAISPTQR